MYDEQSTVSPISSLKEFKMTQTEILIAINDALDWDKYIYSLKLNTVTEKATGKVLNSLVINEELNHHDLVVDIYNQVKSYFESE